jgi:hypothetical protein
VNALALIAVAHLIGDAPDIPDSICDPEDLLTCVCEPDGCFYGDDDDDDDLQEKRYEYRYTR